MRQKLLRGNAAPIWYVHGRKDSKEDKAARLRERGGGRRGRPRFGGGGHISRIFRGRGGGGGGV